MVFEDTFASRQKYQTIINNAILKPDNVLQSYSKIVQQRYVIILEKLNMQQQLIGILGIQGDFQKHQKKVADLGFATIIVKSLSDLNKVGKLIMPGGESTAMRLLLKKHDMWEGLREFCQTKPVFGTCAGAILLAKTIDNGKEDGLSAIDITITRNSYGRQVDSFTTNLDINVANKKYTIPGVFIRAPQICSVGPQVKILATHDDKPILVESGAVLAATFHPELTTDNTIYTYFLNNM